MTHVSWYRIDGEIRAEKIIAQDTRGFMAREKSLAVLDLIRNFQKREMYKEGEKRKQGRGERNKQLHPRLKS